MTPFVQKTIDSMHRAMERISQTIGTIMPFRYHNTEPTGPGNQEPPQNNPIDQEEDSVGFPRTREEMYSMLNHRYGVDYRPNLASVRERISQGGLYRNALGDITRNSNYTYINNCTQQMAFDNTADTLFGAYGNAEQLRGCTSPNVSPNQIMNSNDWANRQFRACSITPGEVIVSEEFREQLRRTFGTDPWGRSRAAQSVSEPYQYSEKDNIDFMFIIMQFSDAHSQYRARRRRYANSGQVV